MEIVCSSRGILLVLLWLVACCNVRPTESRSFTQQGKQTEKRMLMKCRRRCLLVSLKPLNEPLSKFLNEAYKECFDHCAKKRLEKAKFKAQHTNKGYVLLGPQDPVPRPVFMPQRLPQFPKELHQFIDPALLSQGNCDVFGSKNIDAQMKQVIFSRRVSVRCVRTKHEVLVEWEEPKELRNCTGYQINYRFSMDGRIEKSRSHCYEVGKKDLVFVIDKEKGFHGQREVYLAVTALPLPLKCDISMKRYTLCRGLDHKRAKRAAANVTTPRVPAVKILGSDEPIPTGLIMPSVMPPIIPGLFGRYKVNSNCDAPPLYSKPDIYAGYVPIKDVECQGAGKHDPKKFIIYWRAPKNYATVNFTHFQVIYSIEKKNIIPNPGDTKCVQLDKDKYNSFQIKNVQETDSIHVAVLAFPTYDKLEEKLIKFTPSCGDTTVKPTPGTTVKPTQNKPQSPKPKKSNVEIIVGTLVGVAIIAALILLVFRLRRHPAPPSQPPLPDKVYVSYFPDSTKSHDGLLHLVARFRKKYSLNMIMDSLCQIEITELGLVRWCHKQFTESNKFVMIASKKYLKICDEWQAGKSGQAGSNDSNRVCLELQYVLENMFEQRLNSLVTIILADDVRPCDLPAFLRGKQTYSWPKTAEDHHKIACCIAGIEEIIT